MSESDYPVNYVESSSQDTQDYNYYVDIEGISEKWSKWPVIGLVDNVAGPLINPIFNRSKVDLNSPKTPLGSLSFELLDEDGSITAAFAGKDIHEKLVKFYESPDSSLDVSDYGLKASYRIKEIESRDGTRYKIQCRETGELMNKPLIIGSTILSSDIDETQTTGIKLENIEGFPLSGSLYIDEELISYTGIDSDNTLTGVARGSGGTLPEEHDSGTDVQAKRTISNTHLIDTLLQLMTSPGGGGAYDILDYGLGIDQSKLDIPSIEWLRDNTAFLQGAIYNLEFRGDIDNALNFFEKHILEITATRFWYTDSGEISLFILSEPSPNPPSQIYKNDMIKGVMPVWRSHSRRIVNVLKIKLNWNPVTKKYEREVILKNQSSIDKFGENKEKVISTQALQTSNGALSYLTGFKNRFFSWFATPAPQLEKVKLKPDKQFFDPGNVVGINHEHLPNLITGKRGVFGDSVQIIGKKHRPDDQETEYEIHYSTLLNNRNAFIAPTGYIDSGFHTSSVFTLQSGQGTKFKINDEVVLWEPYFKSYPATLGQSTITDVTGDQITVSPAFAQAPQENYRLRYADYSQVQDSQKAYFFIGKAGGGNFNDGSGPYLITA